jgi:hypothetical protein
MIMTAFSTLLKTYMALRTDLLLCSSKSVWRIRTVVFAAVRLAPALAQAHGGMGPDEVGPPLLTSGLLGFVSYWVVMLWPSTRKKTDVGAGSSGQDKDVPRTSPRSPRRTARVRRTPYLRKIEGAAQFHDDHAVRRRASDG